MRIRDSMRLAANSSVLRTRHYHFLSTDTVTTVLRTEYVYLRFSMPDPYIVNVDICDARICQRQVPFKLAKANRDTDGLVQVLYTACFVIHME